MKIIFVLFFQILIFFGISAQKNSFDEALINSYDQFKEMSIVNQRFKHDDIQPLIAKLKENPEFSVKKVGQSIEGRDISIVSKGRGKIQVLLWSQMHGNEPTATMAIMDIFNFLNYSNDFDNVKELLNNALTVHFIPMLNPDGAEKFERRNAINVDINRDALRLQSNESQILKFVRDSLKADWGFNLHDQNRYYGAGKEPFSASISFLAPAYNYKKEINEGRGNAMKLIVEMNAVLQKYIPNKVGRYSDEFEPRAFGDNIQKWGTNTILIESGGIYGDDEKQMLRKLNFVSILNALKSIAEGTYNKRAIEEYEKIPYNNSGLFCDLILREANVKFDNNSYLLDISFVRNEVNYNSSQDYYFRSSIADVGDLSIFYGHEEFNASDYDVVVGNTYPQKIVSKSQLSNLNIMSLLSQGYTNISMQPLPKLWFTDEMPLFIVSNNQKASSEIAPGFNPSLLLMQNGEIKKVVVNGFLYDLEKDKDVIVNKWKEFLKKI